MPPTDDTPGQFSEITYHPIDNNLIEIVGTLTYDWDYKGVANRLTLPENFTFDGASIPAWATLLMDVLPFLDTVYPFGVHAKAAAFHDYIWMYRGRMPEGFHMAKLDGQWVDAAYKRDGKDTGERVWTFSTSNKLFCRQLRELGVGKAERRAMYWAVSSPIGYWNWRRGGVPDDARPKEL